MCHKINSDRNVLLTKVTAPVHSADQVTAFETAEKKSMKAIERV